MSDDLRRLLADLDDPPGGRLVAVETLPATPARLADRPPALASEVWARLGVEALWSHQAEAIARLLDGESVVIATGTASGKSLCFQAAVAQAVLEGGTALLVYPTKALAQDQLRALHALGVPGLVAATYDGDTGPEARTWIRRHANVVLTNPEMLHSALLAFHGRWAGFLRRLRFVVVDELHVLRGVFGSHVAHVLRRLRRLAAAHGAEPGFVFTSATIGEPAGLASELCGLPVVAVTDDGSPRGERLLAVWNPPLVDAEAGLRASTNAETARLVAALVASGRRTVAFCRSRRATELVAAEVRRQLGGSGLEDSIHSYRAGYLAEERRRIEAELFSGAARGVVATSALELGMDIGGLDACVVNGFPGTIASFRQQAGRAGRSGQPSVAVLVCGSDQLDQWLACHPRALVTRPPEPAVVNVANPYVAGPHLACAAYEQPLTPDDHRWWGGMLDEAVRDLVVADTLRVRDGRAYWCGRGSPAPGIGLRSGTAEQFRIVDADDRPVGTVDAARAFEVVHPGAHYLHLGQQYRVVHLDLDDRLAVVEPTAGDTFTQVRSTLQVDLAPPDDRTTVGPVTLSVGPVTVTSQVTGYDERDSRTREVLARVALDLPPTTLVTRAFWYTVPPEVLTAAGLDPGRWPGTLHAVEHAGIGILPLFTICDRWDVGGVSAAALGATGLPTIVIYDGYVGGAGIAELGFAAGRRHLQATLAVIERCGCRAGCPSCVQSPKCGNGNEPLDKAGAVAVLRTVLGAGHGHGRARVRARAASPQWTAG